MRLPNQANNTRTSAALARRAGVALVLVLLLFAGASARRLAAAENLPPPAPAATFALGAAAGTHAAAPSAAAAPSPLAQPRKVSPSPQPDERAGVISFLGDTIAWYQRLTVEERLALEPAEALFVDDDRQTALEAVKMAFQYARGMAALLKSEKTALAASNQTGAPAGTGVAADTGRTGAAALPGLAALTAQALDLRNSIDQLRQQAEQLKAESAGAQASGRAGLAHQLATVQSRIELTQSRLDSYNSLIQFESTAALAGQQGTGLSAQIDALERGVPRLNASAKGVAPEGASPTAASPARNVAEPARMPDNGLLGTIEVLFRLGAEQSALGDRIKETRQLAAQTDIARAPLIARLRELNARADALAAQPGGDELAANRARKREFDELIKRHKAIADALMPLAKQGVLLQLYAANLQRWSAAVDQRSDNQFRRFVIRLSGLGVLLLVVFIAAFIWRSLTFRYVQDLRRRRQLLRLRKLTVVLVVGLVLLFDFASQLGTLATVMGLAAAGVALALQNVILSFAGYFFVTGRYGIRVGDRIQIAGISGDVIDIGLFKLALMELVGDGNSRQPTGRVVVFPNSIVFQVNGNFFKQAPGTSFVWNEFRLTLSPECDYRLAEKRLLEVVEEVYARYRDTVQRQYSALERDLSMKFESPHPQSRLRLAPNGIELTIRYPADTRYAVQVADEISRRALDAIMQDPALSLSMPGTPNLTPLAATRPSIAEAPEPQPAPTDAADGHGAPREPEAAATMLPAGAEVVVEPPAAAGAPSTLAPQPPGKD